MLLFAFARRHRRACWPRAGSATARSRPTAHGDVTVLSWNTLGDAPGHRGDRAARARASRPTSWCCPRPARTPPTRSPTDGRRRAPDAASRSRSSTQVSKARTTLAAHLGRPRRLPRRRHRRQHADACRASSRCPSTATGPDDRRRASGRAGPRRDERLARRPRLARRSAVPPEANVILAGDLNSTLDHSAALGADGGRAGRLPRRRARDRQRRRRHLADPTAGAARRPDRPRARHRRAGRSSASGSIESHDGAGSDHRPIVAQLRPAIRLTLR